MKKFICFKQLLFVVLILSLGIFNQACQKDEDLFVHPTSTDEYNQPKIVDRFANSPTTSIASTERTYMDFTKDPVIVFDASTIDQYRAQGYELKYLTKDTFFKNVSFKNMASGVIYTKSGWCIEGMKLLIRVGSPTILMSKGYGFITDDLSKEDFFVHVTG